MTAPTTAEVRDEIADARRHGRGAAQAGHALALETWALPIAERRDALAAEVARLREVIATKYAIERSSLSVSALVEERGTIALAAGLGADASAAEVAARVGEMRGALVAIGRYDEFDRKRLAPTAHAYGHHAEAVDFARRLAEEAGRG